MNTRGIIESIDAWSGVRSHIIVQRKDMSLTEELHLDIGGHLWRYTPSEWSILQLAKQLRMPGGYMRRCPTELASTHFNHWITNMSDSTLRICLKSGTNAIGILSSRYSMYTYSEFFDDVVASQGNYVVDDFYMTDLLMGASISYPDTTVEDDYGTPGELSMGIHLRNSEVGYSSAIVAATICDRRTGWRIPVERLLRLSFVRRIHRGSHRDFADNVAELITLIESSYTDVLATYRGTSRYRITVGSIRSLLQEYKLAKDILDGHLGIEVFSDDIGEDLGINMREVIDGTAAYASTLEEPRRWNVERICGDILRKYELYALER